MARCEIAVRVVSLPAKINSRKKIGKLVFTQTLAIHLNIDQQRDKVVLRFGSPLPTKAHGVFTQRMRGGTIEWQQSQRFSVTVRSRVEWFVRGAGHQMVR